MNLYPDEKGVGVDPRLRKMEVWLVQDTMTTLNFSAPKTEFNLITQQTSGFAATPIDGIVGMWYYPHKGVSRALELSNKPPMFGLYLIPSSTGDEAELILDGYDASKTTNDLRFANILDPDVTLNSWTLESSSIKVNN
ncbi:hypothetical protein M422DRAFT_46518 [Sphaerobolus stellatus SS14]|uniref:Peptidase A1 domain-containing protein n=1 Tax=Sphaerobolus stellatus (strain SS14) TaxID=990650 RepID=A0A0C9VG50_SPHS4|nr:hypothetical protein M422DRAFT_46518 [Sphaerobolus stellatus SS14]